MALRPRDTCVLYPFDPAIVVGVENGIYQLLLWQGRVIFTDEGGLLPFPRVPAANDRTMSVPDYSVRGVSEIVELVVDLDDAEPPRRTKSSLFPLFSALEALNRETSEADKAPEAGARASAGSDADQ